MGDTVHLALVHDHQDRRRTDNPGQSDKPSTIMPINLLRNWLWASTIWGISAHDFLTIGDDAVL
jgi:hypothetical protein